MNSKVWWVFFDFSNFDLRKLQLKYLKLEGNQSDISESWNPQKTSQFLAGRIALISLLKSQGLDPSLSSQLSYGRVAHYFCSISHTENRAVAALSDNPVGIDIEKKDRVAKRGVSKIASQKELERVKELPKRFKNQVVDPSLFLWTGKEAVSKALGLGLTKEIHHLEIDLRGSPPFSVSGSVKSPFVLTNPTVSFYFEQEFLIALGSEGYPQVIKLPRLLEESQSDERG